MPIPASQIAQINPSVISAGGSALALNGVLLTEDTAVPIGAVEPFVDATSVASFFGATSNEAAMAAVYFGGYDNKTQTPGQLYFYQYNAAAVSAYLRGGSVSALTLADLQALSGTLIVTVDGTQFTSGTIDLSAATSFSDAATIILAGFTSPTFTVTYDSQRTAFLFTSNTTGATSTITEATGTLAASLYLSTATGAVLSQGADATTPATAMDALVKLTQDWVTFSTIFEPVDADKISFASWNNSQNNRYAYVLWETNAAAETYPDTTTPLSTIISDGYSGTIAVYSDMLHAAFVMGTAASIDFGRTNARLSFAFKYQSGLAASVTDETKGTALIDNGYNFIAEYATANDGFTWFYKGTITGEYVNIGEYLNQVYLNSQLQLAVMTLYSNVPSIPYNSQGYGLIRAALMDPIKAALNFGSIRPGVSLSTLQAAEVNNAAGLAIDTVLGTRGWYLQILDPGATVRAASGSPIINLWYMDGGSVKSITIGSILVQ